VEFEWDNKKAVKNLKKHGVSFREAASVFGDPLAITFDDPDHSIDEDRFLTFGTTRTGKMVIVSHCQRNGSMRIISARLMEKHERQIYEEG
jgi:uncharacterized DUF497 family protein